MAFSYKPLWNMLMEKGISKTEFREKLGLSTATLAKLSSDKPVSSDVLARICDFFACGLEQVVIYINEMELFFNNIGEEILGWSYTIYINKWPECRIQLTKKQFDFCYSLDEINWKNQLLKYEMQANVENKPNAGIIGTTKIRLDKEKSLIIINGSFAVTEKILLWIIEACQ